jgi:hypothetical protein
MWVCYLLCALPLVGGLWAFIYSKEVVWWEWLVSVAAAVVACLVWHVCLVVGMTTDQEIWSGYITETTHHPQWVEEYQEAVYKSVTKHRTVGSGKNRRTESYTERVFSHYETRHRTHTERWDAADTLSRTYDISRGRFEETAKAFGGFETIKGNKSGFDSGDPNIYVAHNKTGIIFPTLAIKSWTNRVKSAPSLFSYIKVPEGTNVFEYPLGQEGWVDSNRLLGTCQNVPILEWDRINGRLGAMKKVNLIACGFPEDGDGSSIMGQFQEAAWFGGKKNDLVICLGGLPRKPVWVSVFGWTEREECKRNLESLILQKGFSVEVLPEIEKEVIANYQIKDWSKFDYLEIEPSPWAHVTILLVIVITQGVIWFFFSTNDEFKGKGGSPSYESSGW